MTLRARVILHCLVVCLIATMVVNGENCYSSYVSTLLNTTNPSDYNCPVGKILDTSGKYYVCKSLDYPASYPCRYRSLVSVANTCVRKTRFESTGDECEKSEECVFSKVTSPFGAVCVNGKCAPKAASKTIALGKYCVYPNFNYIFDVCVSGAVCYMSSCTKKEEGPDGVLCSLDEPCTEAGKTCLFIYGKTGICGKALNDGEVCTHKAYCLPNRSCRKSSASDTGETKCMPIAKMGEYCDTQYDCVGGFEIPTLSTCVNKVCKRKYSSKNGESCTSYTECYSGYCDSGVCKDYSSFGTCASCSSNGGICTCGGSVSVTNSTGKCVDACSGPKADAEMCMFNMGAAYQVGATYEFSLIPGFSYYQWFDEKSSLFNRCKTYFQRYYSCVKAKLELGGAIGVQSFGGLSLDNYQEGEPLMPLQPSSSYNPGSRAFSAAVGLAIPCWKILFIAQFCALLFFLLM